MLLLAPSLLVVISSTRIWDMEVGQAGIGTDTAIGKHWAVVFSEGTDTFLDFSPSLSSSKEEEAAKELGEGGSERQDQGHLRGKERGTSIQGTWGLAMCTWEVKTGALGAQIIVRLPHSTP
jgi:hypothetical protein